MTLILDTSEFAGIPDYAALRDAGAEGVIVRGSSGPHADKLAAEHIRHARAAGITPLAVYHYCYSWHDGATQAAFAVKVAAELGLPTCGDFERVAKGERPTDAPHLARVTALAFLRHHRSLTGRAAVVYGPVHYLRDLRLEGDDVGPLWAADTRASRRELGPEVPPPWSSAVLWQYAHDVADREQTQAEKAKGTRRPVVDWNRSELTIEQLQAVFRGEPWQQIGGLATNPDVGNESGESPIGPVLAGVRAAEGRGPTANTFVSRDEGPAIG